MRNLCQLVLLGSVLLIPSQTAAWAAPEMTADEIFAKSQAVMAAPIQYRMVMGEVESIVSMKDLAGEIGVASRVEMVNPVIEQTTITTAKYAYEWPPNTGRSQDLEAIGSAGLRPEGVGGLRRPMPSQPSAIEQSANQPTEPAKTARPWLFYGNLAILAALVG